MKQEMMGRQLHELDHMQIIAPRCRQITKPASHHSFFTGRMLFLMPNQRCQSTEVKRQYIQKCYGGVNLYSHMSAETTVDVY